MPNLFVLKIKGSSMDLWGTPCSIFDHMLKDELGLIPCSLPSKKLQVTFKGPLSKPCA